MGKVSHLGLRELGVREARHADSRAPGRGPGAGPVEKTEAITTFSRQLDSLHTWIARQRPEDIATPPLRAPVETPRVDSDA